MSNPIDNGPRVNGNAVAGSKANRSGEPERGESQPTRNDTAARGADASSQSERLTAVREAIDKTPEVDQARVDELRERITKGEYPLDPNRIADRFAEFESLLGDE
ncbi:flagellar biosynthesis anti-sigma factor FlgM [Arhodomonas sp. AD133]|uniref:flagellar biosynthesis anti-sigma factor FlgM n=1 Tax=Arhodomonas sp. AD133 TaxID=3415009 RepID=UPI003EB97A77